MYNEREHTRKRRPEFCVSLSCHFLIPCVLLLCVCDLLIFLHTS